MHFPARAFLGLLAALPMAASTLEVSREDSVTLHTGDSLIFRLSVSSIADNGILVSRAGFSFTGAPLGEAWNFMALLESIDGSAALSFPNLLYLDAQTGGAKKTTVSTVSGGLPLGASDSQSIFNNGGAIVALRNLGGNITLGRAGYTLADDLGFTFSGKKDGYRASGGGVVTGVTLVEAAPVTMHSPTGPVFSGDGAPSETPEPGTGLFVAAAAAVLWVVKSRWRSAWFCR